MDGASLELFSRHVIKLAKVVQRLEDGKVRVKGKLLGHVTDAGARHRTVSTARSLAKEANLAGIWLDAAEDAFEKSGFPYGKGKKNKRKNSQIETKKSKVTSLTTTAGAEQCVDLPARRPQRDLIKDGRWILTPAQQVNEKKIVLWVPVLQVHHLHRILNINLINTFC